MASSVGGHEQGERVRVRVRGRERERDREARDERRETGDGDEELEGGSFVWLCRACVLAGFRFVLAFFFLRISVFLLLWPP